jgi:hypothetical protein
MRRIGLFSLILASLPATALAQPTPDAPPPAWQEPPPPSDMPPSPWLWAGGPPKARTEINSGALLGVGVGMSVVGTVGTIVGVAVAGGAEDLSPCYTAPCDDIDYGQRAAGVVTALISLTLFGIGVPFIAVGAREVPVATTAAPLRGAGGPLRFTF